VDTPVDLDVMPFNVIWGLDTIHDETKVNPIDAPVNSPEYTMNGIAPFAQVEVPVTDAFQVTGGLRYEILEVDIPTYTSDSGTTVNGGTIDFQEPLFNASASYDITDALQVYGGYSEGFQLGDLGRYLNDSDFTDVSQLSSDGQKTESYELGLRFDTGRVRIEPTVFYNESNNGVSYDENLDIQLAPEKIYGFELAVDVAAHQKIDVGGTLTWMEGRYDTDGDGEYDSDLGSDRIAPAKITGYIEGRPFADTAVRLQALYSGRRDPDSSEFSGIETIEPYFIMDLIGQVGIGPGTLKVGIENLLNEDYVPVLQQSYSVQAYGYDDYYYVKGPGRTFALSYHLKF